MAEFSKHILKEAENQHYKFQTGCYFSDSKKTENSLFLWSDKIEDFYWNYATKINVEEKSAQRLINKIIAFYKTKDRLPVIYLTPFTRPKGFAKLITKPIFKDAWMFYDRAVPQKVVMPENFTIERVKTKKKMKIFVDVFNPFRIPHLTPIIFLYSIFWRRDCNSILYSAPESFM